MPDQAEGLRELVAELSDDGTTHADPSRGEIDYKALWEELKGELSQEASQCYSWPENGSGIIHGDEKSERRARRMLDRMERAETLAKTRFIVVPMGMPPT